ncbi:MAG: hypothetical protein MO846_12590 [Candidatus Devosia symbiotica]|nr:hypothetical protein [Candidatus Devosia symbiotica]
MLATLPFRQLPRSAICQQIARPLAGWRYRGDQFALTIESTWQAHFFLQARWLQQLAMVHDLKQDWQKPLPATVFNLVNGFANTGERNVY